MVATIPWQEFSLVRGGPAYRLMRWLHLVRPPRQGVIRCAFVLAMVGWLPIVLFAALERGDVLARLFRELQVHAELLLSIPALVLAEPYIDGRLGVAVRQFPRAMLIEGEGRARYEALLRRVTDWRDLPAVELALVALVLALGMLVPPDGTRDWLESEGTGHHVTMAGTWYLLVAQPLLRFLVLRWLWRGVVWTVFLWRASRLPLTLIPTHPDMMGGLGFLPICQASFSMVVFAVAMPVAAYSFRRNAAAITEAPIEYVMPQLIFGVLSCLVVFGPLAFFSSALVKSKRWGDPWFSVVAARHSRDFEHRWFRREPGVDPLSAEDFSSLTDLGTSFQVSRRMRLFLYDRRAFIAVGIAALLPLGLLLMLDRQFLSVVDQLRESVS
ncbi:hypothetical protein LZ198_11300 [Myxococcus sp. K15C18031901]|uniref:hypothetical protein n=1 Tax=Myxococcus dinghuensis TaxID=2906761 RepID=UPI0020A79067|nr:hypothetical protein [Myxococcus dinghuensis]MCP3099456.1 hypothetical protein [Myxococcus dinghuensis]